MTALKGRSSLSAKRFACLNTSSSIKVLTLFFISPHPLPQGEREPARGKEFRLRHPQVKEIFDYLYERIGISMQFVVPYAVDRGESLAGGGLDPGQVS
jgi:hypothetical protein